MQMKLMDKQTVLNMLDALFVILVLSESQVGWNRLREAGTAYVPLAELPEFAR